MPKNNVKICFFSWQFFKKNRKYSIERFARALTADIIQIIIVVSKVEQKGEVVVKMDDNMLYGEHRHTIDAKKRLFLPSEFRAPLGSEVVITKSTDKCITVYPLEAWEQLKDKINSLPPIKAKEARRWIYGSSKKTAVDVQGRIAIPQNLCDYAEFEKNIVTIGVGDYAEIWSEAVYDKMTAGLNASDVENILIELGM